MKIIRYGRIALPLLLLSFCFIVSGKAQESAIFTVYLPSIQKTYKMFFPMIGVPVIQWIGPDGGTIMSMAAIPTNPDIIYAATYGGGVFKSEDGGADWKAVNNGLENLYMMAIAIDPNNPNILFTSSYKDKLYKSVNGGESWTSASNGLQNGIVVYDIAIDPVESNRVYLSSRGISNDGQPPWKGIIYRSIDSGASWQPILSDVGGPNQQDWAYSLSIEPESPYTVYAAFHEYGVRKSLDWGDSWSYQNIGITDKSGRAIEVDPFANYRIFFGVWHTTGIFYSKDHSNSWALITDGIVGSKIKSLAFNQKVRGSMFVGTFGQGFKISTDGGQSWTTTGLTQFGIYSILADRVNGSRVFAGTSDGGLFLSTNNGLNLNESQTGLHASNATGLTIAPDTNNYFASSYGGGVDISMDKGGSWLPFSGGLTDPFVNQVLADPSDPSSLMAITQYQGLFRYDPVNNSWAHYGNGLPSSLSNEPVYAQGSPLASFDVQEGDLDAWKELEAARVKKAVQASSPLLTMQYAPSNPSIAYIGTGGNGVYTTSNGGINWTPTSLTGKTITSLIVNPGGSGTVFAASSGQPYVYYTFDSGVIFVATSLPVLSVETLAWADASSGKVYAGTNDGLYCSDSEGVWTQVAFDNMDVTAIGVVPGDSNHIFVSAVGGTYESTNGGSSWSKMGSELDRFVVRSIQFDQQPGSRMVYFLTSTSGIYRISY